MNATRATIALLLLACIVLVACSAQTESRGVATSVAPDTGSSDAEAAPEVKTEGVAPAAVPTTGSSADATTGLLRISLTDAPAVLDLQKAMVTISSVQVHRAAEGEADDKETESGWYTIVEAPATFDLIALLDVRAFLGSAEMSPGKYTQVRLSVDDAMVTIGGTEHQLTVPSGKIKLVHPFTIEAGQTTELTLDFDAQESVHAAGRKYMMRPTIKVIVEGPASGE